MFDTIQRMAHRVRTAYGGSNLTYVRDTITKELNHFIMVICQVNGCAPQLCSIIISIVFSALRTQGFGIHFVKSSTTEIAQLVGFVYVKECDMIQSDDEIESTFSQMQLAISELEDLIIITEGYPSAEKIVWYLVDY